jgi:hypothetical protein
MEINNNFTIKTNLSYSNFMGRTKDFNLKEYIRNICRESNVDPDQDVFNGSDLQSEGYSITFAHLLTIVLIQNWDPAYNPYTEEILESKQNFVEFIKKFEMFEAIPPKQMLIEYLDFAKKYFNIGLFITSLPLARKLQTDISYISTSDEPVFISGETGTGKELAARAIHKSSNRTEKPFEVINCAALSRELLHSEMFGHVKGAFTGASKSHLGWIKKADGGTLFLDEIGDSDPEFQSALLRYLSDKTYSPVGSTVEDKSDVRIISATNAVSELNIYNPEINFRSDIYYRLAKHKVFLIPLRASRVNIPLIIFLVCGKYKKEHHFSNKIDFPLMLIREWYRDYEFPGNYREFRNQLEDYIIRFIHFKKLSNGKPDTAHYAPHASLKSGDDIDTTKYRKIKKEAVYTFRLMELINNPLLIARLSGNFINIITNHEELIIEPYLWNALQDIDRNTGKVDIDYANYNEYSTIRSNFPLEEYKNDVDSEPEYSLGGLANAGYELNEVAKLYLQEFFKTQDFKSRHDLAIKLGYKDEGPLTTLLKKVGLDWPIPPRSSSKRPTKTKNDKR